MTVIKFCSFIMIFFCNKKHCWRFTRCVALGRRVERRGGTGAIKMEQNIILYVCSRTVAMATALLREKIGASERCIYVYILLCYVLYTCRVGAHIYVMYLNMCT